MDDQSTPGALDESQVLSRFSRARIGMVLTDPSLPDNPIVYVNEAFERITGYARTAAVGQNCRFLQGKDTDPKVVKQIRAAIESCEEISVEILNYRANGQPFRIRLVIAPVADGDNECAMFMGLQIALDERKQRSGPDAVRIDRQLAEIQHRVKNHLSMIVGMIRVQSRQATDPDEFQSLARRVESLQLLYEEMSLADTDHNRDGIPLGSYVSRIANAISHIDGRPGVRVNVMVEPLEAPVHAATQVGLILSEILTNAFQHAFVGRDGGTVEVRMLAHAEGGLRLTVADDGIGLPEGTEWPKPGSLGGQIVEELVRTLNGTINVSRGTAGTLVTVDVPRLDAQNTGEE